MVSITEYPNLQILPAEIVKLHEHHDPQRTEPLFARIREDAILKNPPLVAPLSNGGEKYMVLDGANRVTAMKNMGFPHILAQVVDPDSPNVGLNTWNHVIWNIETNSLIMAIDSIPEISCEPYENEEFVFDDRTAAFMQTPDGPYQKITVTDADSRSVAINKIVGAYMGISRYDRTQIEDLTKIPGMYNNLAALIVYPPFTIQDVLHFTEQGKLLPAGVTRFSVAPRALRINYPLSALTGEGTREEKQAALDAFIKERMNLKGVRIYTEPTVLYDE
ncbi:MAG TPA: hypothetical protein VJ965_00100 [Anaerolineales bacterium]|nr:hypothetical protein [Anaerolineales bacterium]